MGVTELGGGQWDGLRQPCLNAHCERLFGTIQIQGGACTVAAIRHPAPHQARCTRKEKTLGVTELGGGRWDGWRQPGLNEHCEQPFYIQIKSGACTVAAIRPPASHQARCTRKERTLGVAGLGGGQWDGWRQSCLNEHSRSEGAIRQLRPAPPRTSGPSPLWRRRRRSSRRLRPCGSARDRSTC